MKKLIFTILIILSVAAASAKEKVLYFEYENPECKEYYCAFEIDTLDIILVRMLVYDCRNNIVYEIILEMEENVDRLCITKQIILFNECVTGEVHGEKKHILSPFMKAYFVIDGSDWNRLILDDKKNGELLDVCSWFPPYLNRVKEIDWNRFPKKVRKGLKKRKL